MIRRCLFPLALLATLSIGHAQAQLPQGVRQLEVTVDGTPHTGLVYTPASATRTPAPVVTLIHPGDHKFPDEAPPLIVKFFKEQAAAVK